jgi:hypothetical protein
MILTCEYDTDTNFLFSTIPFIPPPLCSTYRLLVTEGSVPLFSLTQMYLMAMLPDSLLVLGS